jgi:peptidyl-prolyl isomerase D
LEARLHALKISCYSNLALCFLKVRDYAQVIGECTKVLEMSPLEDKDKIKAHFRRAMAYQNQKNLDAAMTDFEAAYNVDGGKDAAVKREYVNLKSSIQAKKDAEKKAYSKLFG